MRDGVDLLADIYRPDGDARGTLLVRDPYGRAGILPYAFTRPFVSHGYQVIYQSCRGTFGSGGVFEPARAEAEDSRDTVQWMRRQPWYTGTFATLGGSYTGFTQWALRADEPDDLAASVIAVGPHDLAELAWDEGAFRLDDLLGWAESIATQEDHMGLAALRHGLTRRRRLASALDSVPVLEGAATVLGGRAPWFNDLFTTPDIAADYWRPHRLGHVLDTTTAPALLLGGWHDVMLRQSVEQYHRLTARGVDTAMTIGPWAHGPDLLMKGAVSTLVHEALAWFDHHLAGEPLRRPARVRILPSGSKTWRESESWPHGSAELALHIGTGLDLLTEPPVQAALHQFTYDPRDPTPSVGGNALFPPSGPRDNEDVERRSDLLVLTGPELTEPMTILGTPQVTLRHRLDGDFGDLHVRLCAVDRRGRSTNVSDSHLSISSVGGTEIDANITMAPTAQEVPAGTRLRLQVAGGAHPAFARRLDADPTYDTGPAEPRTHTVLSGPGTGSAIRIPVGTTPPGSSGA